MTGVTEYGGVAGRTAINQDLEETVAILMAALNALDEADNAAMLTEQQLRHATPWIDISLQREVTNADVALQRLRGNAGIVGTIETIDDTALALREAAEAYANAEHAAMLAMSWGDVGNVYKGVAQAGWWLGRWAMSVATFPFSLTTDIRPEEPLATVDFLNGPVVRTAMDRLCAAPAPGATSWASMYELAATTLHGAVRGMEALWGRPTVAAWIAEGAPHQHAAPTTVEGLMSGISRAHGAPEGAVFVEILRDADGNPSAIVSIPGTNAISPQALTSLGPQQNLSLVLGEVSLSMEHAIAAIEAAQLPQGTPVLLQGHSQGGMVAMALAQSEWFRSKHSVTHVMTVGSPAGHFEHVDNVDYLHIINRGDIVPALGCGIPPDQPNVVTNVFTMHASDIKVTLPHHPTTVVGAHDLDNYAAFASHIDADAGPSTRSWLDSAEAFLGGHELETTLGVIPTFDPQVSFTEEAWRQGMVDDSGDGAEPPRFWFGAPGR